MSVTVFDVAPVAETVTVALRLAVVGLASTVSVSVPLPESVGVGVSHCWSETADQTVLEVNATVALLLASFVVPIVGVDSPKVAAPAA